MFSLLIELVIVVGVSVLAHMSVAYIIAPERAKKSILNALVYDKEFQMSLMQTLVTASSQKMKWKDENGEEFSRSPIELLSSIISILRQSLTQTQYVLTISKNFIKA